MKKGSNVVSDLDSTSDDDEVKVGAESDLLVRFKTADSFIQGLSLRLETSGRKRSYHRRAVTPSI